MAKILYKRYSAPALALAFIFVLCGILSAEDTVPIPVKIISSANKKSISIGQPVFYTITVYAPRDIEIGFPKDQEVLGPFEVKDSGLEEKKSGSKQVIKKWYVVTSFDTGEQSIPGQEVLYKTKDGEWQKAYTKSKKINVRSVFQKAKITADIKDIQPLVEIGFAYTPHLVVAAILLVIFAFLARHLAVRRRQELERLRQGPPMDAVIYQNMSGLLAAAGTRESVNKEGLLALAEYSKQYIIYRFKLGTHAITTDEFLLKIRTAEGLYKRYGAFLESFLRNADLVKYAGRAFTDEEAKQAVAELNRLLKDYKPESEEG